MKPLLPLIMMVALAGCRAGDPGPLHTVAPGVFRQVLAERGEIGSEQELKISSPFSGKIDNLLPEGTLVKPGAVVGRLGAEDKVDRYDRVKILRRQEELELPLTRLKGDFDVWSKGVELKNAELDLRIAKLNYQLLDQGRAGVSIVEAAETLGTLAAEATTLTSTLPEAEALLAKGYLSDNEVAVMRKRMAEIKAETRAMRIRLKALEAGPRKEALSLERLKVEAAAAALAGAKKRLRAGKVAGELELDAATLELRRATENEAYRKSQVASATLKAPAGGVVIYDEIWTGSDLAKLKPGDTVEEGMSLVTIADPTRQIVKVAVNDAAAANLRVHQVVRCAFDAYPGLTLMGQVAAIAPVASDRLEDDLNKLQALDVRVALNQPDPRLKPGMSANLAFVLAEEPDRLVVPTQALVKHQGAMALYVYEHGALSRRAVTVGRSNERESVILTGLNSGDQVALQPPGGAL